MKEELNLYDMKLHEIRKVDKFNTAVMRVPGGWIYKWKSGETSTTVFVPYHIEFDHE